jgi:hypothetical protein
MGGLGGLESRALLAAAAGLRLEARTASSAGLGTASGALIATQFRPELFAR